MVKRCHPVAGTPGAGYLWSRGILPAHQAGARYAADWYGRPAVVFPLRDQAGRLVAANGRHTDGRTDPKTHTVGDRRLGVFSTPGAFGVGVPLVLVEGPLDALALAVCVVPAVALVATTAPHWLRVAAAFRRVLVALDADAAGERASAVLVPALAPFARSVERLRPPVGKDWNDALLADAVGLCAWLEAAGVAADATAPPSLQRP